MKMVHDQNTQNESAGKYAWQRERERERERERGGGGVSKGEQRKNEAYIGTFKEKNCGLRKTTLFLLTG